MTTKYATVKISLPKVSISQGFSYTLRSFDACAYQKLVQPLATRLKRASIEFDKDSSPELVRGFKMLIGQMSGRISQDLAIKTFASFSLKLENYKALDDAGLTEVGKVWRAAICNLSLTYNEVHKLLGRKPLIERNRGWYAYTLPELALFPFLIDRNGPGAFPGDCNFSLSGKDRAEAYKLFFGKSANDYQIVNDLPDKNLIIENFLPDIANGCIYLSSMNMCGTLLSASGTITLGRINSLVSKMEGKNFAPGKLTCNVDRKSLFTLAFGLLAMSADKDGMGFDSKKLSRFVVDNFAEKLSPGDFQVLMPMYKGFTKPFAGNHNASKINTTICSMISVANGCWLNMDDFIQRWMVQVQERFDGTLPKQLFELYDYKKYAKLRATDAEGKLLPADGNTLWCDITRPYIAHFLKLLCATGILELAIDPDADADSLLEGIKYVRLTDLGKYALKLTDDYVDPVSTQSIDLEFDNDSLIITVLNPKTPLTSFLELVGRRIGGSRFYISAETLIASAPSQSDARNRLDTFISVINPNPTGTWADMVAEARLRLVPLLPLKENYAVVHVNTDVPGLVDAITNLHDRRDNIIFAQNGYLLINRSYYNTFATHLRKLGYQLP